VLNNEIQRISNGYERGECLRGSDSTAGEKEH